MFYRLKMDLDRLNVYIRPRSHFGGEESLKCGLPMPKDLDIPFLFSIEIDEDEVPIIPSYDSVGPIFDKRLVETLLNTGVDNIEVFPAIVANPHTGKTLEDYFAVNVIGLVSCADMVNSDFKPIADVHFFFDLSINTKKTHNLLMFRLAEQPADIIIHEKVAKVIRQGNFTGIIMEHLVEI